ncbi:Putative bifunctional phosphatase/peptidyl-prolyl cis-trans isomerase [Weissella viridescens]|uniref:Peptidyl-prolyl cis-trans isomerase n=1 Tax=Weissella viridescens TaxID=1629 RepID=A0A380NZU2_WEIVI|nr:Putative bifunctional phosphatase/peptidyl-prolyl cis-trans isomerase [Weissella viridescens]
MTLLQAQAETIEGPVAQFETTKGIIKFRLFPEQAPKTVENFMGLISDNYYDGTIFHRVIADFMLQGGDPSGTGMGGTSIYGKKFNDEFSSELFNFRGALSMANSGPNTNGSQFFIVQATRVPAKMLRSLKGEVSDEVIDYYAQTGEHLGWMGAILCLVKLLKGWTSLTPLLRQRLTMQISRKKTSRLSKQQLLTNVDTLSGDTLNT